MTNEGICIYCGDLVLAWTDIEPSVEAKQEAYTAHMKRCVKHPYYEQHKRTLDAYQGRAEQTAVYRVKIEELLFPLQCALKLLSTERSTEKWRDVDEQTASAALSKVSSLLNLWYPVLGMCGEAGEIANKIKKVLRDKTFDALDLGKENGDVLWYVADFASQLELSLNIISDGNLQKLAERKLAGTIEGSGDNR